MMMLRFNYDKETFFNNQPAIQPVANKNLKRIASGFGFRPHPKLGGRRFHKGIDFSAHMQRMDVKVGQKIKHGDQIGTVGITDSSTGPHLHYEVYKNKKVEPPVYYFFNDLSEEEYEEILKESKKENKSLS